MSLCPMSPLQARSSLFFFNDTATTEIYTLSLHDALPIYPVRQIPATRRPRRLVEWSSVMPKVTPNHTFDRTADRKSTRLNSSHLVISYAVFCLKKKKNHTISITLLQSNIVISCARPHTVQ